VYWWNRDLPSHLFITYNEITEVYEPKNYLFLTAFPRDSHIHHGVISRRTQLLLCYHRIYSHYNCHCGFMEELLWIILVNSTINCVLISINEKLKTRSWLHPLPAPPLVRHSFLQGLIGALEEYFRYLEIIPCPNRCRLSGGRSHGSETKFWNNLI
jgi:hypothetical protein